MSQKIIHPIPPFEHLVVGPQTPLNRTLEHHFAFVYILFGILSRSSGQTRSRLDFGVDVVIHDILHGSHVGVVFGFGWYRTSRAGLTSSFERVELVVNVSEDFPGGYVGVVVCGIGDGVGEVGEGRQCDVAAFVGCGDGQGVWRAEFVRVGGGTDVGDVVHCCEYSGGDFDGIGVCVGEHQPLFDHLHQIVFVGQ